VLATVGMIRFTGEIGSTENRGQCESSGGRRCGRCNPVRIRHAAPADEAISDENYGPIRFGWNTDAAAIRFEALLRRYTP